MAQKFEHKGHTYSCSDSANVEQVKRQIDESQASREQQAKANNR